MGNGNQTGINTRTLEPRVIVRHVVRKIHPDEKLAAQTMPD